MPEFDLISRLQEIICFPPGCEAAACRVGIGDDAAVLDVPADSELVVCTDTLVAGVHFPEETDPAAIGHKALAVNLSDLAAMGALPAWFFMALTLPSEDREWLDAFAHGMAKLAGQARITLAGGDVSCGPLSITITALGLIEKGRALVRSGAEQGNLIVVSGRPGAAAHALRKLQKGDIPAPSDRVALDYPAPRVQLGYALNGLATACIDISDGLMADLGHILEQSHAGAEVELDKLPCPASARGLSDDERWSLQLAGGDDYELCFTISPESAGALAEISRSCGVELTVIGVITAGPGLALKTGGGELHVPRFTAYQHFDGRKAINQ
jgi:thiamine-monophosphate kinase